MAMTYQIPARRRSGGQHGGNLQPGWPPRKESGRIAYNSSYPSRRNPRVYSDSSIDTPLKLENWTRHLSFNRSVKSDNLRVVPDRMKSEEPRNETWPRTLQSSQPTNEIRLPVSQNPTDTVPLPMSLSRSPSQMNTHILPSSITSPTRSATLPDSMGSMHANTHDDRIESEQYALFRWEFSAIQQRRLDILSLRSKVRKYRVDLRDKQGLKARAEDRLLQRINADQLGVEPLAVSAEWNHKTILELSRDCQAARDDYGPCEDECNQLEDQLSRNEYELQRDENEFYGRWDIKPGLRRESASVPLMPSPATPDRNSDEDEEDFGLHPLAKQYLSRKGDLWMLREQLDDLEEEQDNLEELQRVRRLGGMSLGSEDQEELDEAVSSHPKLVKEIGETEEEVEQLRDQCFKMGLVDEIGDATDTNNSDWKRLRSSSEDGSAIGSSSEFSAFEKFPLLHPKPELARIENINAVSAHEEVQEATLEHLNESSLQVLQRDAKTKSSFEKAEDWLLQNLKLSSSEAYSLERISREEKVEDTMGGWEILVLQYWNTDDDGKQQTTSLLVNSYCSSLTTQAPRQSPEKTVIIPIIVPSFPAGLLRPQPFNTLRSFRSHDSSYGSDTTERRISGVTGETTMGRQSTPTSSVCL